jgi:hypothetical protein
VLRQYVRAWDCAVDSRPSAQWRISHHGHLVLLAPGKHVTRNSAVGEVVKGLVGRAAIAMRDMEKGFHVTDIEVGDSPCANLPAVASFSNAVTTVEKSVIPLGQCNR